jgi:glycosyltransferase involved in cell wall biosynthesis
MKKRVLIVGSVKLPIPAVKGGAVPNLIEEIIIQQQIENQCNLSVCSLWDEKAVEEAQKYTNTQFIWAKVPRFVSKVDNGIRWILKNVIKKDRILSLGFVSQILWYTQFVSRILARNDFDVVIFENSVQMLSALKLKRNYKKYQNKYYIHMHSVPRKYSGAKKEFEKAKGIICISKYVANAILKEERTQIEASKVQIMYNCIDTTQFKPFEADDRINKIKGQYNISQDKKLVVFAGRLCQEKGVEVLLKAIKEINRDDIILLIVGSNFYNSGIVSPYEAKLQRLAEDIKDKIVFTGYVDYSEMPKIYNIADVVVLPSMWEEPAGMTIIEAMSCGKAVITTVSGGIPEYVGENNCILLKRDEKIVSNIVESINVVLNDDKYRKQLERRSLHKASMYNIEYYYKQFMDIVGGTKA